MKSGSRFVIFILILFSVVFAVNYRLPKKFVWIPTFAPNDKQPFGCALTDSLLAASLPSGYTLSDKTFYQMAQEDSSHLRGILLITDDVELSELDVEAILKLAERGNNVLLAGDWLGWALEDTLGIFIYDTSFSGSAFQKYAKANATKDTLCWMGDTTVYQHRDFEAYPALCRSYVLLSDEDSVSTCWEVLAERWGELYEYVEPVAVSRQWGKGEIIFVSTPLLFTNYGVTDPHGTADYVFRLLSQMEDLPVVRTLAYRSKALSEAQQSPLRYILRQPPLRWALYLSLAGVILLMAFTAKRKQRVIPVVREPQNTSLEFVKLIGTLYFQRKDHTDLLRKKFTYWTERLRYTMQVDIGDVHDDERSFQRIAQKTGKSVEEVGALVRELRLIQHGSRTVSAEQMKQYIDRMNNIVN